MTVCLPLRLTGAKSHVRSRKQDNGVLLESGALRLGQLCSRPPQNPRTSDRRYRSSRCWICQAFLAHSRYWVFYHVEQLPSSGLQIASSRVVSTHTYRCDLRFQVLVVQRGKQDVFVAAFAFLVDDKEGHSREAFVRCAGLVLVPCPFPVGHHTGHARKEELHPSSIAQDLVLAQTLRGNLIVGQLLAQHEMPSLSYVKRVLNLS